MSDYEDDDYGGGEYKNYDYGDDDYGDDPGDDYGDDPGGDYGDDPGDDPRPDEIVYEHNFNVIEQIGDDYTGCWEIGKGGEKLPIQTPLGRFCIKVDAIARNIESECKNQLGKADIKILLDFSQELPRVRYKNPTAFVLGYLATKRGTSKINKISLNSAYDCYQKTSSVSKDESVKKADIIRYARLWKTINK